MWCIVFLWMFVKYGIGIFQSYCMLVVQRNYCSWVRFFYSQDENNCFEFSRKWNSGCVKVVWVLLGDKISVLVFFLVGELLDVLYGDLVYLQLDKVLWCFIIMLDFFYDDRYWGRVWFFEVWFWYVVVGVLVLMKVGLFIFDFDDEGFEYKDWLCYGELDDQFCFLDVILGGRFLNFFQGCVFWRVLGMCLFYIQNGFYVFDEDVIVEFQFYLRGLFWGLLSDDFVFGLFFDEVMVMIKQVVV